MIKPVVALVTGLIVFSPQATGPSALSTPAGLLVPLSGSAPAGLFVPMLPPSMVRDDRCVGFAENQIVQMEHGAVCVNNILILPGAAP